MQLKSQLENGQRERRKQRELRGIDYQPMWFCRQPKSSDEEWQYNGKYWEARKHGFAQLPFELLW